MTEQDKSYRIQVLTGLWTVAVENNVHGLAREILCKIRVLADLPAAPTSDT